jgi:3-deoxy-D-manno-octulosonic-acid transferase
MLFFYLYSIVSALLYLVTLPFLFLFSFQVKYRVSIPARFLLWRNPPLKPDGVWFHSCSFGEAKAIKPLVDRLSPEILRMTTTTHTGKRVTEDYTHQSRYLPFEPLLFVWMKPQKVLVVMEAEFWYLLFALAKRRGAKTLLVNARMSDRSFPRYQRIAWLYRQIFKHIDEVYAQTVLDKERLEALGATHVTVTGNIKLAQLPKPSKKLIKPTGLLLCAASTHEGEEELILDAFLAFKKEYNDARLVIVPRHPERFDKVVSLTASFASERGYTLHRYSTKENFESDITVMDRLGELVNVYAISDIVILGGSFEPVGGHNAAEAAQFGCRILSGPYYFNQKDIFDAVEGITIVQRNNLVRTLLHYRQIRPARLVVRSDISPILYSIEEALETGEKDV